MYYAFLNKFRDERGWNKITAINCDDIKAEWKGRTWERKKQQKYVSIARKARESRERDGKAGSLPSSIVSEAKYLFCVQSAYTHIHTHTHSHIRTTMVCAKKAVPSYCRTSNVLLSFSRTLRSERNGLLTYSRTSALCLSLFLFLFLSNTHARCLYVPHFAHTCVHTYMHIIQARRRTHVSRHTC